MELKIESQNLDEYLKSSDVIDYNSLNIVSLAKSLSEGMENEIEITKRVYEYVRDEIAHSGDIKTSIVTCNASDVLEQKHGICCAKAHLFAALLRYLNIPVGFCYQWLISDNEDHSLVIHGLNAVYLRDIKRWIRLDARGNKEGVNAEFSIDTEKLAWPVRYGLGEKEDPVVYFEPKKEVIEVLRSSKDRKELSHKWITANSGR